MSTKPFKPRRVSRRTFLLAWAEDLRTTTIKQGKGCLSSPNGDCCLGIGCRTAARLGIIPSAFGPGAGQEKDDNTPGYWFDRLVGDYDPTITVDGVTTTCIEHNDDHRHTFPEIAGGVEGLARELARAAFKENI